MSHISYKDHVTNEKVRAKIQQALAVVCSCLSFIRSGKNHLARHSERGKKTRQTEGEVGRQHQGMTDFEFAKSKRAVENREHWRKLVAKPLSCPNDPRD